VAESASGDQGQLFLAGHSRLRRTLTRSVLAAFKGHPALSALSEFNACWPCFSCFNVPYLISATSIVTLIFALGFDANSKNREAGQVH